jgi:hypothetical protein
VSTVSGVGGAARDPGEARLRRLESLAPVRDQGLGGGVDRLGERAFERLPH